MSDLQARLKSLTPEQIRRLMAQKNRGTPPDAMAVGADGSVPASLAQERFWFLSRLYPDTPDYNIPLAVLVDGPHVDRATLQRNLDAVVANQEILRTTFHERDGKVVQVIHPPTSVQVEYEDRSDEYAAAGHPLVERLAVEHGATVFAVDKLPLLSVKLVKLAPSRHLVMLNLHHLISDGWSNSLLSQMLSTPAHLPAPGAPPKQYRHFVEHERAWLKGDECRAQLAFWQDLLRDPPQPPVFAHRPDDGVPANAGGFVAVDLPTDLCERIARHCSALGRTPFQYYMGCFALLMTRYTGENDLIVGTPVVNRNQPQFLQTCGLFINTLPMRFRFDPRRTFAGALTDCAEAIQACLARQELPYAELVKHVQVNRSVNENPLFNLHFAFQYFPHQKASSEFQLLAVDHGVGKFDLNCFIEISASGNRLSLSYRRRAFQRAEIERMAAEYVRVLEQGLSPPDRALGDLELISPESASSCAGPEVARRAGNWYALFAEAAKRWPDRMACADATGELSYAELEASAGRVAAALARRGVGRGDRVILRARRDRHYVIGLLACLRLGAIYVPLSADAPPALQDQVEAETAARIALGEAGHGRLPCLSMDDACAEAAPGGAAVDVGDADLAYIVYTSGSTGTPKGVAVTHAGLVNYTLSLLERLGDAGLGAETFASFAHLSALDADLGNTAIFPPLACGGALLMPDSASLLDGGRLASFFRRHPADVAKMVPSHLRALRPHLDGILPKKVLVCGGEALDAGLVAAVRRVAPGMRILNHYGPAEATIGVLTHAVDESRDPIPLGRPIANTRIHLVDRTGRRVPRGRAGELYVEGPGLASRYLGQAALTAERFVAPVFAPGARAYRSGDLAYMDEDGAIVFLGRRDNRVKVGGVMVQPEAVAALLRQHGAVAAAHVWHQDDEVGNTQLMGAVVLNRPTELVELREHLLRHYKPAQCPMLFALPELPLNANGKVDPQRLRAACADQAAVAGPELPRDALELTLQSLFRQVLGAEVPTLDADFFDLGGTSLQAITLMGRVNQAFSLQLPVTVLFEAGSVQGLAEVVRREGRDGGALPVVALADAGQDEVVVWIHPAGGNAMCYLHAARALSPRRASVAISAWGQADAGDITTLACDYHERIRHEYGARRVVLAGWSMGALIAHEMAGLAAEAGHAPRLVLLDQPVPRPEATPGSHATAVALYLEKVEVFTGQQVGACVDSEGNIDYARIAHAFVRLGLAPPDVRESSLRGFLDLLVYHNAIIHAFRPRFVPVPTLLLKASEHIRLKNQQPDFQDAADLGWGRHCQDLTVQEVAGNHMTMLNREHVQALIASMEAWLSR